MKRVRDDLDDYCEGDAAANTGGGGGSSVGSGSVGGGSVGSSMVQDNMLVKLASLWVIAV